MTMQKITEAQETKLQKYLDGELEGPSLQLFKQELGSSPELQHRLEMLRSVEESLKRNTLQSPSSVFVDRVMNNLAKRGLTPYPSPRNGLMLLAGVIVASGLLAMLMSTGSFDNLTSLITFNQIEVLDKYQTPSLPAININGKLIMKFLIGINLVLAFVVLDRTVLRPYFQRRAGQA
jgi:anti-sigma factor RsiW